MNNKLIMLDDFLLQVNKPARYVGSEWNVSKKNFERSEIKFALCFPDLYEVGMSNLGVRVLYGILNSIEDVVCERVFSCDSSMENILRQNQLQLLSLESRRRLADFDFLGFSLASELGYTNVLNILELAGIPLKANERGYDYPLVIGGGPCTLNPEPLHAFFDLFVIGEAEELILELVDVYRRHKKEFKAGGLSKQDLLFIFSQLEGVYVPMLYEVDYDSGGQVTEFNPKIKGMPLKIKKRFVKDLDSAYFPKEWLVPYIQIIHDRITLELMRGCPNRCRFCQARSQYFPLRYRKIENILDLASETQQRTGYEEISLCGLSVSDYPGIEKLLEQLIVLFKPKAVSVSLPSIKAKAATGDLSKLIATVKKTGLTFAPEAGSERLRNILAKDFSGQDFFQAIKEAYSSGYQHVKLYFMIGLPYEEEQDLDAIADFCVRVSELRREACGAPAQVNISINTLIPKPHTPLQWFAMESLEGIKQKQDYLKNKIKNRRLKLSFHHRQMAFLEGILSRGDRRLSEVILLAFKKGARFDAWGNYFDFRHWEEAFTEAGIEPAAYLKGRAPEELLPWDFIDVGIAREALLTEFNKLIAINADKVYNKKLNNLLQNT